MKFVLELTRSQQMALIDLIAETLTCHTGHHAEQFVNCSENPEVTTTPGELLRLVSDAKPVRPGERA
jgi:hypothetical protein